MRQPASFCLPHHPAHQGTENSISHHPHHATILHTLTSHRHRHTLPTIHSTTRRHHQVHLPFNPTAPQATSPKTRAQSQRLPRPPNFPLRHRAVTMIQNPHHRRRSMKTEKSLTHHPSPPPQNRHTPATPSKSQLPPTAGPNPPTCPSPSPRQTPAPQAQHRTSTSGSHPHRPSSRRTSCASPS